jgi:hypothetical protein
VPMSSGRRWSATSYGLMGPGLLSTLHFLACMLRSPGVAIMAEKQKIIFQLDSGDCFSVLPFSPGHWSNDKSYCSGQIWPAPRALFYPASLLGLDLLSQLKAQILLPTGGYLCCPLLQEQIDPTVWTDRMTVGQARTALPSQIKLKDPSQFPHPKQYPLKPEG